MEDVIISPEDRMKAFVPLWMAQIDDDDDDDGMCSPTFLPGSPKAAVVLDDRLFPFRFSPLAVVVDDDDAAAAGTMAELLHPSVPSST